MVLDTRNIRESRKQPQRPIVSERKPAKDVRIEIQKQLKAKHTISEKDYANFERNLWNLHLEGEISYTEFVNYKKILGSKYKGTSESKKPSSDFGFGPFESKESYETSHKLKPIEREEITKEREQERLFEEEKMPKRGAFNKIFTLFFQNKGFRLLVFVVLGAVFLFLVTKSTSATAENSPYILILGILFLILILGKGGTHRAPDSLFSS